MLYFYFCVFSKFAPLNDEGFYSFQVHLLYKRRGCISLWWGVMMCDVLLLASHWLEGVAHCFTVQFHPVSSPLISQLFVLTMRRILSLVWQEGIFPPVYHQEIPGPVWWCQHTVWYGIHSEVWYSPVGWLPSLPLWSAVCLCPFHYPSVLP